MTHRAETDPAETPPEPPINWHCLRCGNALENQGEVEFRVGGHTGAAHLLLGNWADLGEGLIDLVMLRCPRCGQIDLFDPSLYPTE